MTETILIPAYQMKATFSAILETRNFTPEKAATCAEVFTTNSVEGVYTHGVNRFPRFVQNIEEGFINPGAEPVCTHHFGSMEQWDGKGAPGPLNAIKATERATTLAQQQGISCLALSNTNHWMRGGYYGWQAAKRGFVFIGWTNTIANLPAWNATDSRLGNNPLVIALPYGEEAIVLDMAMSQFSFGTMELSAMKGEMLPVYGGFDRAGELSKDPSAIMDANRALPVGYWKGAGLSLLLDLLATVLSGGLSTKQVTDGGAEHSVSQVFVAIDLSKLGNASSIAAAVQQIILDYEASLPVTPDKEIRYPGERVVRTREDHLLHGIPVLKKVWEEITSLRIN